MLKSTMFVLVLGLLSVSVTEAAEGAKAGPIADLEPTINGAVSASGLFPDQAMEDEFVDYLAWTKTLGLSRLAAFEGFVNSGEHASRDLVGEVFKNAEMAAEFDEYLQWVRRNQLSPFYAFKVSEFD